MSEISDELLMAYVDGELGDDERRRVQVYIENDPAAAARLKAFEATGRNLGTLFARAIEEPVPKRLLLPLQQAPRANAAGLGPIQESKQRQMPKWSLRGFVENMQSLQFAVAVAASATIGVGFGLALGAARRPDTQLTALTSSGLAARAELHHALDRLSSGQSTKVPASGQSGEARMVLTFAARDGGICRQFVISQAVGASLAGIACRTEADSWRVRVLTEVAPRRALPTGVVPAGQGPSSVLDDYIGSIISGDALGATEEAEIISRKWNRPKLE